MLNTIRVIGEKEGEVRSRLQDTEKEIADIVLRRWNIRDKIYSSIFFVVFPQKDRLGSFLPEGRIILLSESLLYSDFSVLRNVFIHETAHALDHRLNGYPSGHTPQFREYCIILGIDQGFEKAKLNMAMKNQERVKEKMEKLMALSSSPFENEAMIALSKARKLLLENEEILKTEEKKEDKIYEVDLYESGRVPYYVSRLSSFTGKATGSFVVKVLGNGNKSVLRAYGRLEEVEAALYLFSHLLDSLEEEIKRLRKNGMKVTKDSFAAGACPEMEKKLRSNDESSDRALTVVQDENRRKAKRLVFSSYTFTRSTSHATSDSSSMAMGRDFGKKMDISSSLGRKEIKG